MKHLSKIQRKGFKGQHFKLWSSVRVNHIYFIICVTGTHIHMSLWVSVYTKGNPSGMLLGIIIIPCPDNNL